VTLEFDTERLRLRQWRSSDLEAFARMNADRRVMEFYPAALERGASDAMAQRIQSGIAERGWGLWAAQLRVSGEFIGYVGLQVAAVTLPCSPCVEVGWRLAHAFWGRGLATEAARGALRVGFRELGLPQIVSFTALINRRSRAVMERLGMREDEAAAFDHPNVPEGSPLRAHCLYRLSRENWAELRAELL
jgi:RimJ/RimL family protein N-acetyltransferase